MNRERAMEILMNRGWDEVGAEAIVDEIENLDGLTEEQLNQIAEDYEDR